MSDPHNPDDPKGLVREAYRIEGISDAECRSILIDWALSLPLGQDQPAAAARLLADRPEAHPMTALLVEAAAAQAGARRRGGRAARIGAGQV